LSGRFLPSVECPVSVIAKQDPELGQNAARRKEK
jgi:hypothetical protein